MQGLLGLSLPIFLKAVRVQYDYCIVLRLLTIKHTYFLLSLSIFSEYATPMFEYKNRRAN